MEKHRKTKIKDITNARRYVKSSTMCDTHFLNCRRKKKKKLGKFHRYFFIFANILLKHLVLRFFLKITLFFARAE